MQVSWIDPEEVASLAEALRPPVRAKEPAPAPEATAEVVQPLLSDQEVTASTAPESSAERLDLSAFRQKLQSIREKAIHAGLLTPQSQAPQEEIPSVAPEVSPEVEPEVPVAEAPIESPISEVAPEMVPLQDESLNPPPAPEPDYQAPIAPEVYTPAPVSVPAPAPEHFSEAQSPVWVPPTASVKERLEAFAEWTSRQWGQGELLVVDEYGDLLWGPAKRSGLVLSTMMAWNAAIRASVQAANGLQQIQQQYLATGEGLSIIPCHTRLGLLVIAWVKQPMPADQEAVVLRNALIGLMNLEA